MGLLSALQETMGNKVRVNKISDSERGMIFTVYGGMGTGKSTFAYEMSGEERGIWICMERGISAFPNVISLPSTTFAEVKSNVEKVTNKRFLSKLQEDEYPYLIFDGAESMGLMIKKYIADNAGKENLEDIAHGKGWSQWEELFENFIKGIIDSGVTAIFIFHEDETEEGKKVVAGNKRIVKPIVKNSDFVIHLEPQGRDSDGKEIKSTAVLIDDETAYAKNRFSQYFETNVIEEFSAEKFRKLYKQAMKNLAERKKVNLVSYEEKAEVYQGSGETYESVTKEISELLNKIPEDSYEDELFYKKVAKIFGEGIDLKDIRPNQLEGLITLRDETLKIVEDMK